MMSADPLARILRAWVVPGAEPNPQAHRAARARLRAEWPELAGALDEAEEAAERGAAIRTEARAVVREFGLEPGE